MAKKHRQTEEDDFNGIADDDGWGTVSVEVFQQHSGGAGGPGGERRHDVAGKGMFEKTRGDREKRRGLCRVRGIVVSSGEDHHSSRAFTGMRFCSRCGEFARSSTQIPSINPPDRARNVPYWGSLRSSYLTVLCEKSNQIILWWWASSAQRSAPNTMTANPRLPLATDRQRTSPVSSRRVVVLPDGAKVDIHASKGTSQPTKVTIDGAIVAAYRTLPRSVALVISAVDTPHQNSATHIPKFSLIEVLPPSEVQDGTRTTITPADLWGVFNVFHTLYHAQETIPIVFSPAVQNAPELSNYLLISGLARKRHTTPGDTAALAQAQASPELFLLRETFWQGAGTAAAFHARGGWLRGRAAFLAAAPFPLVQSFTRTDLVIAAHPLRPPKPHPGELVYRKYFPSIGQSLEFTYFDATGEVVGTEPVPDAGGVRVSRHLATFHRWHNSDHVNRGWGERGPLEKHRKYVEGLLADPGVLPVIMSWDGEFMGYAELVYLKVDHSISPGGILWTHPSAPKHHRAVLVKMADVLDLVYRRTIQGPTSQAVCGTTTAACTSS